MPVVIITPSKATPKKIHDYILQPEKTEHLNGRFLIGQYCEPKVFDRDFYLFDKACGKSFDTKRRKYYHIKISFAKDEDLNPFVLRSWAARFIDHTNLKGCMVAGAIHTDTVKRGGCYHMHLIVNNTRFETNEYGKRGYSYQVSNRDLREMKMVANELCREFGFEKSIIDEFEGKGRKKAVEKVRVKEKKKRVEQEEWITGVMVEPDKPAYQMSVPNTEEALQEIIGGNIEAIYPEGKEAVYLANEDGRFRRENASRVLFEPDGSPYDIVCGNFFIVGLDFVSGEHRSLRKDEIEEFEEMFKNVPFYQMEKEKRDGVEWDIDM